MPGLNHRCIFIAIIGFALIWPYNPVLPAILLIHDNSQKQTVQVQNLQALRSTASFVKKYLHVKELDSGSSSFESLTLTQTYEKIVLLHSGQPETEKVMMKLNTLRKETALQVARPNDLFAALISPEWQSQANQSKTFTLLQREISFEQNTQAERTCILVSQMPLLSGKPLMYKGLNKYRLNHDLLLNNANDSGKIWCAYKLGPKIYLEEITLFKPEFTITADKFFAREKIISSEIRILAHSDLEQDFHLNLRLLPTNEKQAIYAGTRLFNYDAAGKWFFPVNTDNTKKSFTFTGKEYRQPIAISAETQPPLAIQVQVLWQDYPIATNKIRIEYAGLVATTIHYLGMPLTLAILIPLLFLLILAGSFSVKKLQLSRMRHGESNSEIGQNFVQLSFLLENFQTRIIKEKENPFNVTLPGLRETVKVSLINDQLQLQISDYEPISITENNHSIVLSGHFTLVLASEYYTENTKPVRCVRVSIRKSDYSPA